MKNLKTIVYLALLLSIVVLGGCKKNTGNTPTPLVKTRNIAPSDTENFTYDAQGRVINKVTKGIPLSISYSYNGNTITAVEDTSGISQYTFVYTLGSSGLTTSAILKALNVISSAFTLTYYQLIYDSDGHLITETMADSSGKQYYGLHNTWTGGNLTLKIETTGSFKNDTFLYTYSNQKSTIENENMGMSWRGKGSENLPTTRKTNALGYKKDITYRYTYDAAGRVATVIDDVTNDILESYTYY